MDAVRLDGVSKRLGGRPVVDGLSLTIAAGSYVCLLGPSGCGKTTTLRILAGFEEPDAGVVRLAGQDMRGVPPHRRPCNLVFQDYALFPHRTVAGNVAFGLETLGLPRDEIRTRVAEALALVRMEAFAERRPEALSGGQRQRVATARAIVRRPPVLLLDEPLGALDLQLRRAMQGELKALQRRLGTTFVHVTHDQEEALALSDRIAVLNEGTLAQEGTPEELYERPDDAFVARFLGEANVLAGTRRGDVVATAAGALPTDGRGPGGGIPDGGRCRVVVRPERIAVRADPAGPLTVVSATFAGSAILYGLRADDGTECAARRPAEETPRPAPGTRVALRAPPDAVRLLPPESP